MTEGWLTPLIGWLLPKKRPMDNVATGWDRPQEDEFALCSLGLPTPYRSWAFPQHGPVDADWLTLENVSDADRQRWGTALRRFVGVLSLKRAGRVILKSPPHTARIKTILEHFPDARFVHISRDPLKLFPSTVRLWKSLCDVQSLQSYQPQYDWIEEEVFSNLTRMYEAYDRDRGLIPEGRLVEVSYEDLVADPKTTLATVYDGLSLGDFAKHAEPGVHAYLAEEKGYKTNRFELADDVKAKIGERWHAYAEQWGYATSQAESAAT
ncbi:MAG: sulfotransferase [Planctomycetota bacterium]